MDYFSSDNREESRTQAVAFRENINVFGGINCEVGYLCTAEVLDTRTKQFTTIKSMRYKRHMFAVAISEHKLYCFGGVDIRVELNSVESFDLYSERWQIEENDNNMPAYVGKNGAAITIYDD